MGETSPVTCAELEGQQMVFLAANVSCTDRWYNVLRKYSFATEGVGLFSVAVVGVLANLLSIAVLCQRTMKTQITALLITLAIFDILFLICTLPVFTVQSVNEFVAYLNECYYDKYNSKFGFLTFNENQPCSNLIWQSGLPLGKCGVTCLVDIGAF